jgi:hypothetical protein
MSIRKPWMQKLADLFGVKPQVKYHSAPPPLRNPRLPAPALRSAHRDFPLHSMRRGVQVSKERRQRPARLAWIYESCRQAREIAVQLKIKRQVRAELRKAAA